MTIYDGEDTLFVGAFNLDALMEYFTNELNYNDECSFELFVCDGAHPFLARKQNESHLTVNCIRPNDIDFYMIRRNGDITESSIAAMSTAECREFLSHEDPKTYR